jgi:hypothetical protein
MHAEAAETLQKLRTHWSNAAVDAATARQHQFY